MSVNLIKLTKLEKRFYRQLNVSQEKKLDIKDPKTIQKAIKVLAEHLDSDDDWIYAGKVFAVELAKFRKIQRLQRTLFDIETDDRTPDLSEAL